MRPKRPKSTGKRKRGQRQQKQLLLSGLLALVLAILGVGLIEFGLPARSPKGTVPARVVASIPPPMPPREFEPPVPAVSRATETAAPPVPHASERPPWLRFAVTAPPAGNRPRIAIVIDDCGLDRARTERTIALPAAVTMSFMTYAPDILRQTDQARRAGHELLVHVPMEPMSVFVDMGPNGLAVDQPRDEVLRRLRWDLERFDGYVGINNHMGSRFTADAEAMGWVLGELKARGLLFLDSRTVGRSAGEAVAASLELPFASRDVFLDDEQTADAVEARLKDAEAVARRRGTAIAIGHPHDATLAALNLWIAELSRDNIVLVPLTDIVKTRMAVE